MGAESAKLTSDQHAWKAYARAVCADVGLSWPVFDAQINEESGWRADAVSPAGAQGIAQIIPRWHPSMQGRTFDPLASLEYAARLMASLVRSRNGDYCEALADYNTGANSTGAFRGQGYRYADTILRVARVNESIRAQSKDPAHPGVVPEGAPCH